MQKTQNKTALRSQNMLVQAMLQLLKTKEYKHITISEIATSAGLDRKTFYRNFDTKEDILKQHCHTLAVEMLERIKKKGGLNRTNITASFFELWSSHISLLKILKNNNLHYLLLDEFYVMLGIVRKDLMPDIDASAITKEVQFSLDFNIGGYWNLLFHWLDAHSDITPEQLTRIVGNIFKVDADI